MDLTAYNRCNIVRKEAPKRKDPTDFLEFLSDARQAAGNARTQCAAARTALTTENYRHQHPSEHHEADILDNVSNLDLDDSCDCGVEEDEVKQERAYTVVVNNVAKKAALKPKRHAYEDIPSTISTLRGPNTGFITSESMYGESANLGSPVHSPFNKPLSSMIPGDESISGEFAVQRSTQSCVTMSRPRMSDQTAPAAPGGKVRRNSIVFGNDSGPTPEALEWLMGPAPPGKAERKRHSQDHAPSGSSEPSTMFTGGSNGWPAGYATGATALSGSLFPNGQHLGGPGSNGPRTGRRNSTSMSYDGPTLHVFSASSPKLGKSSLEHGDSSGPATLRQTGNSNSSLLSRLIADPQAWLIAPGTLEGSSSPKAGRRAASKPL